MQVISRPLEMTEAENKAALAASEPRLWEQGDPEGNRQQRRAHARYLRKQQKRERVNAND